LIILTLDVKGKMAAAEPPLVRLYLLGPFRAERAGVVVPNTAWRLHNAKAIVKILATDPGRTWHRETLQDTLWPNFTGEAAYNGFRKALHLARHALEPELGPKVPSAYLHLDDDIVSLDRDVVWTDADEFDATARRAIATGDVAALERAVRLYQRELLPEDRYAPWSSRRRDDLARLHVLVLLALAEMHECGGRYADAIQRLDDVVALDPSHEAAHRALMRLHAVSGRRHDALRQYRLLSAALLAELDVPPDRETQTLYEAIEAGEITAPIYGSIDARVPVAVPPAAASLLAIQPHIHRAGPTDRLTEQLDRVLAGAGGTAMVSGEAGVGKSCLIADLAQRAAGRGALVLWGASFQEEGRLPYGPVVDAFDTYLRDVPEDDRRALSNRFPELAHLIPALHPGAAELAPPSGGDGERMRLFAGVIRLLTAIAADRPLMLVLEDLHAADAATLQLLHYLGRSAATRRWMIVGSYRDEEISAGVVAPAMEHDEVNRHVRLQRFDRDDADRFVRLVLGGEVEVGLLDRLYERTHGNLLFLQQLVDAMRETEQIGVLGGRWQELSEGEIGVPTKVRELIDERVKRLDDDTQETLVLASIIGLEAPVAIVRAASRIDETRLLTALDHAAHAGVLDEGADLYIFRNPLVREVVRDRLSPARRMGLHAAIAAAIEHVSPDQVEALAYHFGRSGLEEPACRYLELAGDRAGALFAYETALTHYQEVLKRLQESGQPLHIARLESKIGRIFASAARYDEALSSLERAADLYASTGDMEHLGLVTAQIGSAHGFRGTPNDGSDRIEALLRLWTDRPPTVATAQLYSHLAILYCFSGRYEEQLTASERASEIAAALGNHDIQAEAENNRGMAQMCLGDIVGAVRTLKAAIPIAEASGAWTSLADINGRLSVAATLAGRFDDALIHATRAKGLGDRLHDPVRKSIWGTALAFRSTIMGEWDEARRLGEQCLADSGGVDVHNLAPFTLYVLGWMYLAKGEWETASEMMNHGWRMAEATGHLEAQRAIARVRSELALLTGRSQEALDMLLPVLDRPGLEEWDVTLLLPCLAWAHKDLGARDEAAAICETAIVRARHQQEHVALADLLRVQGEIRMAQGAFSDAESSFRAAVDVASAMPYPLAHGRALAAWGTMLCESDQTTRGHHHLHRAVEIFVRLGARRFEADTRKVQERFSSTRHRLLSVQ
jgi:DNA-binding SARP family transcriptional activator